MTGKHLPKVRDRAPKAGECQPKVGAGASKASKHLPKAGLGPHRQANLSKAGAGASKASRHLPKAGAGAPKAGAEDAEAPNKPPPKPGEEEAPNAGVEEAPKAGVEEAPKAGCAHERAKQMNVQLVKSMRIHMLHTRGVSSKNALEWMQICKLNTPKACFKTFEAGMHKGKLCGWVHMPVRES
eukprot:1160653-Pelagomonas_calceolata.AAC.19